MKGGKAHDHAFTALFCNGKRCGDAPREEAPHQRPAEGKMAVGDAQGKEGSPTVAEDAKVEKDGEGLEGSPCLSEGDQGLEGSPCVVKDGEGLESSPSVAEEGEGLEGSPNPSEGDQGLGDSPGLGKEGQGQEEVPDQGKEGTPRQPMLEGHCDEDETHGCGCEGSFNIIEALGIYAGITAYLLMLFNAWMEWMEY